MKQNLLQKALDKIYGGQRGPVSLHQERNPYERSFADLLPYDTMIDDGVMLLKDGSLMTSYEYAGEDTETVTESDMDSVTLIVNRTLAKLGSGFTIAGDTMRMPVYEYLNAAQTAWQSKFAEDLDKIREKEFLQNVHYISRYFLTIIFTPESPKISALKKLLIEDNIDKQTSSIDKTLKQFKATVNDVSSLLSSVIKLKRLSHEEQLSYIYYCITGEYQRALKFDEYCYLDSVLAADDLISGFKPKIGKKHIRALSLIGFPATVAPDELSFLNKIPLSFRWSNRFIVLDEQEAVKTLSLIRAKWGDKKDSVASLIAKSFKKDGYKEPTNYKNRDADIYEEETEAAILDARLGHVKFGHYTSTIILYDEDRDRLEKNLRALVKYFNNIGFFVKEEDINAEQAYLGSLPGNLYANVRRPVLHTENMSCLLPLYSFYQGKQINPCPLYPKNSPAIMVVNSEATTPFYFNIHVGDVGMTAIFGPTGSGKSTLLNLIMSQFLRYKNARIFSFDKKYSAYILTRTLGGAHINIMGPNNKLSLTPFKYILNGKAEVAWATDYISTLCQMSGLQVGAKETNLINDALQSFVGQSRIPSMSLLINRIQDLDMKDALKFYSSGGAMGELLDGDKENLESSFLTTFETLHLMEMNEKVLNSTLLYLFHWIQNSLTGAPTLIMLDEAWSMLRNAMFVETIRGWLKLLRSLNGAVIFATQGLSDVMNSPISDIILESCLTKILLPNIEAKNDVSKPLYKKLGLSDGHVDIISSMMPKRDYFYMSPEGKRIMNLELDPYTLKFFDADMEHVKIARKIEGNFYEQWKDIELTKEA